MIPLRKTLLIAVSIVVTLTLMSCNSSNSSGPGGDGGSSGYYFFWLGDTNIEGTTYRIQMYRGNLYALNDDYGLMVFDPSYPDNLDLLGYYSNYAADFQIQGDYAYLAGDGLEIADLFWSDDIQHEGDYHGVNATDIIVQNNYAYVADIDYGLRIFDISDPWFIFEVDSYFWGQETTEIEMYWPYIFGIYDSGMWVMSVDDQQQIDFVTDYAIFDTNAICVHDGYVYLAGDMQITALDISDIEYPQEVGHYSFYSPSYDLEASGSTLFVAAGIDGIVALDISNPTEPAFVDSYFTTYNAWQLDVVSDRVYAAVSGGILILRFGSY